MRLFHVEKLSFDDFFGKNLPPYAILSHTWGATEDELSFSDVKAGNTEKAAKVKLEGCCEQAKRDKLKYIWIDTCCIDKNNATEVGGAINSMFLWYRRASICYAYLPDVSPRGKSFDPKSNYRANFLSSRWFRRGWTLQELLAPIEMCFFDQTWTPIGSKVDLSRDIELTTGIPQRFLLGWEGIHEASVAQRMSWASKRETTRDEDTAYCLLGIFGLSMDMRYGEGGEGAFIRLQRQIIEKTGDHSILAWGLHAAESLRSKLMDGPSAGALATAPSSFANCGCILSKQDATLVNTFEFSVRHLRMHLPLHTTPAGVTYGLLNCGPDAGQVVGVPLRKTVSGAPADADEYLRPQGRCPILLPNTTSASLVKAIHIRMERQSRTPQVTSRRYWLCTEGFQETNLKLTEVHPSVSWKQGRALIAESTGSDRTIARRYLIRFCTQDDIVSSPEGPANLIVVLDLNIHMGNSSTATTGITLQFQYHVMILSSTTPLEDLSQKLAHMRPEAFGQRAASNGDLDVDVAVTKQVIAQDLMLVIELGLAPKMPKMTVDANWELQQVDWKIKFAKMLQQEDQIRQRAKQLGLQRTTRSAAFDQTRQRLAVAGRKLQKLKEEQTSLEREQRSLECEVTKEGYALAQLKDKQKETSDQLNELLGRKSEIQRRLDEYETQQGHNLDARDQHRPTPLILAARNSTEAVARNPVVKGPDPEAKDDSGSWTSFIKAARNGHKAVARILSEEGADSNAKNKSRR